MKQSKPVPINQARDEKLPRALRLIILLKLFKGTFLLLTAFGIFALINKDVEGLAQNIADHLHVDPDNHAFNWILDRVANLTPRRILGISLGTFFYAGLLLTEAVGLYWRQSWARWLTIIATASFIPLEVYEIIKHVRPGRIIILAVNVLILIYLIRHGEMMRHRSPRHHQAAR
jgi:uncharacterized membrane protein (DUF2068 family)